MCDGKGVGEDDWEHTRTERTTATETVSTEKRDKRGLEQDQDEVAKDCLRASGGDVTSLRETIAVWWSRQEKRMNGAEGFSRCRMQRGSGPADAVDRGRQAGEAAPSNSVP